MQVYDPSCPFCPGNEARLPPVIAERTGSTTSGWQTRVVPNRFPIVGPSETVPIDVLTNGYGLHEVIIETPRHNADLTDLSFPAVQAVVETWFGRFCSALAVPGVETILVFRNHGPAAGASLRHPHSQLVALPIVPPKLATALAWARSHRDHAGECVTCCEQALELEAGERVVEVTKEFSVLVPFAATSPFEQWIVPRRHMPSFKNVTAKERAALAGAIQRALLRFKAVAGDAAYNLAIEPGSPDPADKVAAHWAVRIVPDVTIPGGFEMLSGIKVNPSSPEEDAQLLRDCSIDGS